MSLTHTPAEVAAKVGASEFFVRELARKGKVPHLRVGRSAVRFTDDHVAAIIAHLTHEPTDATPASTLTTARSRKRAS